MVKKKEEVLSYAMSPKTGQTHPGANFNFRMEEQTSKEKKMSKADETRTARAYKDKFGFMRIVVDVAANDGTVDDVVKKIISMTIPSGKMKGKKYHATDDGVRKKLKKYRKVMADSEVGGSFPTLKDERAVGKKGPDEMARYLAQLLAEKS